MEKKEKKRIEMHTCIVMRSPNDCYIDLCVF